MNIKFINLSLLLVMHISFLFSMENHLQKKASTKMYKIITSDGFKDEIPQKHLHLCKAICSMLEDCPDDVGPIPLPINSEMLPLIKNSLKNSYSLTKNKNHHMVKKALKIQLDTPQHLYAVLTFADQLDAQNLLNYCIKLWAKAEYDPQKTYILPEELNKIIARHMQESKRLIKSINAWTAKRFAKESPKKNYITQHSLWSTAVSSNGCYVAGGDPNGHISIYNLNNDTLFQNIDDSKLVPFVLQFNDDDNQIWASGEDGTIKIWDLVTGNNIGTFQSPLCCASVFRYIPQFKILVTDAENHKLCFWDVMFKNNTLLTQSNAPEIRDAHILDILAIESTLDGFLFASTSKDGFVHVWNTPTKHIITSFKHDSGVMSVQFSHTENRLVCGLYDGTITLYDLVTAKKLTEKKEHTNGIWSVLYADKQDTLLWSGSADTTIKLWDVKTLNNIATLACHTEDVQSMAINYPQNLLVSASQDKTIKVWDIRKLFAPIYMLQKEISNCTIENILTLKNANTSKIPLKRNNPLFQKFSAEAHEFLLENEIIEKPE